MMSRSYWLVGVTAFVLSGAVWLGLYTVEEPHPSSVAPRSIPIVATEGAQPPLNVLAVLPDLEYVDTPALRALGLSGRRSLSERAGLLFIFEESSLHGFWMKDMHFAIDMIWLNEANIVAGLKEGAIPESFPEVFYPTNPARYVLETNVGFIARHNLKLGDMVWVPRR